MPSFMSRLGIRQKLLLAFLTVVTTVLLISYVAFYLRSQSVLQQEVERSLLATAALASSQLESRIDSVEIAVRQIQSRTQLRHSLRDWLAGERVESAKMINRILADARNTMPAISNVVVFSDSKEYVAGARSDFATDSISPALFAASARAQGYLGMIDAGTGAQRMVVGGSLDLDGQRLGTLFVLINIESFDTFSSDPVLRAAGMTMSVSMIDKDGKHKAILPVPKDGRQPELVFNPFQIADRSQSELRDGLDTRGVPVRAVLSTLTKAGWGLAAKVDRSVELQPLREQTYFLLLLAAFCLLFSILFTVLLSGSMTRPILNMTHVTELIASGDMDRRISNLGHDELGLLARAVNQMADRLILLKNELELRVRQQEQSLNTLNQDLSQANDELTRLSGIDALTGIANRRAFEAGMAREWARCRRQASPVAILAFDIDHFKGLNDSMGHAAGDVALQKVAATLQSGIRRASDVVARVGGEEFSALLPDTPLADALELAEELRLCIVATAIAHPASSTATVVTVSIGVAALIPDEDSNPQQLMAAADQALYQAKASGRNRVLAGSVEVR